METDPLDSDSLSDDLFAAMYAPRRRVWFDAHTLLLIFTLIALGVMGLMYFDSLRPVEIAMGTQSIRIFSNQVTVAGVLHDAAINLAPEDVVFPALDALIPENQPIAIRRAQPLRIQVDGETIAHRTQSRSIAEALREANVFLKPYDRVLVDGQLVEPTAALTRTIEDDEPSVPQVVVQRAVPIQIDDNGALRTFYTTAPTLGGALQQAALVVYLGDYLSPDLGTPVEPGSQIIIRRSRPATINVDGRAIRTRTRTDTVANLLKEEGIELAGKDYTIPEATAPLRDDANVQVMRVREDFITESEPIPFETVWQSDPTLELDQHLVTQVGVEGVKKRSIRITYENGREVRRSVDKEWIDATTVTRIISYGTNIVHRDLTLPDGSSATYWRKLRVHATSYTAATSGKARTHPYFGKTFLGLQAGLGIVAVDPQVINLRSRLYVPGYGLALAGDTGGRIKGLRIDLGYDESNLVLWYKWVDVYLLDPPPPPDQIRWVIPDTPRTALNGPR